MNRGVATRYRMTQSRSMHLLSIIWFGFAIISAATLADEPPTADSNVPDPIDPAGWGIDHVGESFPEYMTGDECLFCHRKIGSSWPENGHLLTFRPVEETDTALKTLQEFSAAAAQETQFVMGDKRIRRFLKRSPDYGKLDIHSFTFRVDGDHDVDVNQSGHWDSKLFADRCAGCHATAIDSTTRAYSALSLDCYTCHGDVGLGHETDPTKVFLSVSNRDPKQVNATCSQCHLRGGKSKSTGLPYPNTFVPGDNLFRDFQVDWSDEAIESLSAIDQHIFINARDVAVFGKADLTCISCHNIHEQSSDNHQELSDTAICANCHLTKDDYSQLVDAFTPAHLHESHNPICGY